MEAQAAKLCTLTKPKIRYEKKGTVYQVLGVGKAKQQSGQWEEGVAFIGDDGVYYLRPYHLLEGFNIIEEVK